VPKDVSDSTIFPVPKFNRLRDLRKRKCVKDCMGHGECNYDTGACLCIDGWTGAACETKTCPKSPNGIEPCR
jgi:hypothetical protein